MDRPLHGSLLLVGEGDFSLSVALVHRLTEGGGVCGHPIVSTSLETEESIQKHRDAEANMAWLREQDVTVCLNTDATLLHQDSRFTESGFSRIVFNFPHAGGKSNHKKNRKLLNDFFASATKILEGQGQIMVTLCKGQGGTPADKPMRKWCDSWQVVSMAANSDLVLTEVIPFSTEKFIQYRCTGYRSQDKGFNTEGALIHAFQKASPVDIPTADSMIEKVPSIPGERYFRDKESRKLLDCPCHPVHKLNKLLKEHLGRKLEDMNAAAQKPNNTNEQSHHCKASSDSRQHSAIDNHNQTVSSDMAPVMFTDKIMDTVCQLCGSGEVQVESALYRQDFGICPGLVPINHVLICTMPVAGKYDGCVTGDKPITVVENDYVQKIITLLESLLSMNIKGTKPHSLPNSNTPSTITCIRNLELMASINDVQVRPLGFLILHKKLQGDSYFVLMINLDRLASQYIGLPDERLLWSREENVMTQLRNWPTRYEAISLYPMKFTHDMSFWENGADSFDEFIFFNIIRDVGGDVVSHVTLIDRYHCVDMDKYSRCYRLIFQSLDRVLSYDASWKIQSIIRLRVANVMKVVLR